MEEINFDEYIEIPKTDVFLKRKEFEIICPDSTCFYTIMRLKNKLFLIKFNEVIFNNILSTLEIEFYNFPSKELFNQISINKNKEKNLTSYDFFCSKLNTLNLENQTFKINYVDQEPKVVFDNQKGGGNKKEQQILKQEKAKLKEILKQEKAKLKEILKQEKAKLKEILKQEKAKNKRK